MPIFNWTCPYCNRHTTITEQRYSAHDADLYLENKDGFRRLASVYIVCPNPECGRFVLEVRLHELVVLQKTWMLGELLGSWRLIPNSSAKPFPDYIPKAIRDDYEEACAIRYPSPKAAATLCRRCLQGMIRDFWKISKARLKDEVDELKNHVDGDTWVAIDAVRSVGNVGAHMEKDVNVVVDVEPDEAEQLIGLIETLLEEWYIARNTRQERMKDLKALAAKKAQAKNSP